MSIVTSASPGQMLYFVPALEEFPGLIVFRMSAQSARAVRRVAESGGALPRCGGGRRRPTSSEQRGLIGPAARRGT